MTELLLLGLLIGLLTAVLRVIRRVRPGALQSLSTLPMRTPLRHRLFGAQQCMSAAGIQRGWRVLEVGCGWGFVTREACRRVGEGGEVVAVDTCPRMLERCSRALGNVPCIVHRVQADGSRLPFRDNVFDVALVVAVMGEVRDQVALLSEIHRCLKPGATAVVGELVLHPDFLAAADVERLALVAGMEVEFVTGNALQHTTRLRKPQFQAAP